MSHLVKFYIILFNYRFVDIIHTDAGTLGIGKPIGHLDFFPNGGLFQVGCGIINILKKEAKIIKYRLDPKLPESKF